MKTLNLKLNSDTSEFDAANKEVEEAQKKLAQAFEDFKKSVAKLEAAKIHFDIQPLES